MAQAVVLFAQCMIIILYNIQYNIQTTGDTHLLREDEDIRQRVAKHQHAQEEDGAAELAEGRYLRSATVLLEREKTNTRTRQQQSDRPQRRQRGLNTNSDYKSIVCSYYTCSINT